MGGNSPATTNRETPRHPPAGGLRFREDIMALPALLANTLELPVVGSPLFLVSGPELVIAQCKAGIVGSFPALNARPVEKLDEWLARIENELGEYKALHPEKKVAPYAVNQICHASNDRLMKDMETCVKHRVPIIITSLRPPIEIVEARSEEHTSELQSMSISYAVFCLKKKKT